LPLDGRRRAVAPGILMHFLEAEFGWNRAAIGLAVSIYHFN
jgi:hypothetical protein